MNGKRLFAVWPLGLALFVSGCGGSDPPPDAVISAVETNKTTAYTLVTVPTVVVDGVIHFKVQRGTPPEVTPLSGVKVELSGSSPTVGDTGAGFVGGSSGGSFLNTADPGHVETTTNGSGVVAVFYQFTVPKCSAANDLTVTATVSASVGVSTATWIDNITVKKDPTC
jgi:hypothetical protein